MSFIDKTKKALANHFTDTYCHRTQEQVAREKWLIPNIIPFNRYMLMPAGFLVQCCVGSLYAWSGYNLAIEAKIFGLNNGIDRAIAVNVFYLAVAWFSVNTSIFGPWVERQGPMKATLLAAGLFYFGNLLTALGVYLNIVALVFVGYGIFGASGIGIAVLCAVATLQEWFPEIRGIAAGLALCGFGAGSIIAPYTQKALIGPDYPKTGEICVGIELTFVILGSCYFVIMSVCALVFRMPPPGFQVRGMTIDSIEGADVDDIPIRKTSKSKPDAEAAPKVDYSAYFALSLKQSLMSREFLMMYFMFFGSVISGLLIISKVQSIAQNQLGRTAIEAASINAGLGAVNLLGRMIPPLVSDMLHTRKPFYCVGIAIQAVCVGCLPTALDSGNYGGVLACAFIICFLYGSALGMIPAFLADQFGGHNAGPTFGVIMTAWGTAGIAGGLIFSKVYSNQKALHHDEPLTWYDVNFRWILGPVLFSFIMSLLISTNLHDKRLPKVLGENFRFRLPNGRLVRVVNWKPHIVPVEQEHEEWRVFVATLPPPVKHVTSAGRIYH